ncbi:hydrolase 1, exosortase A system-associated [Pacificimonas flava]|uniref:Esterase/lipase/thioesterase n=1 Tax=Pacificimonas flava TaxID=1234595 RepID=M2U3Z8_9SPHN|nr:hydrolase 1, exosortase A system-associated [Pacificimonas flava]EMD82698.1 esterase/lipase/thioesterase [Pacificimonas flava]MBB5281523.1 exosortase A-associated hydrolase 1 [Pacificimonas flava]
MTPLVTYSAGEALTGWLHEAGGDTGALVLPGGAQTRAGPHRLFLALSLALADAGIPSYRFDRSGLGDSGGDDAGFRSAAPDIAAAAAAFRNAQPHLRTVVGIGLCDGATALLLTRSAVDRLILLNPWAIDQDEGAAMAPEETRAHYRRRLLQPESWKRILTGRVNPLPALRSLLSTRQASPPTNERNALAAEIQQRMAGLPAPPHILLSDRDRTAQAFRRGPGRMLPVDTHAADHAFSGPGERERLFAWIIETINRPAGRDTPARPALS